MKVERLGKYAPLIKSIYGDDYSVSGSEMIYECPYCLESKGDRKLYVNFNLGIYNCFRCGASGKLKLSRDTQVVVGLQKSVDEILSEYFDVSQEKSFDRVYIEIPSCRIVDYPNSVAYQYMKSRGITIDDMDFYDFRIFGEGANHNRVVLPNQVINQNFTDFYTARAIFDDKPKYLNSGLINKSEVVYNLHRVPEGHQIIINEGIINSIIAGYNSVAILGKFCSEFQFKSILQKKPSSIIISLDTDAIVQSYQLADRFIRAGVQDVRIAHLPDNKDASELGRDLYQEYIDKSEDYSLKGQFLSKIEEVIKLS